MTTRWKISAVFSLAALLVSSGFLFLLLWDTGKPGWVSSFSYGMALLRFAALPALVAAAVAYLFAPVLIQNRTELTLCTVLIILVTHFVYFILLGVLTYFDSPINTDPIRSILSNVFVAFMGLVIVSPAYLLMALLLPALLRLSILRQPSEADVAKASR